MVVMFGERCAVLLVNDISFMLAMMKNSDICGAVGANLNSLSSSLRSPPGSPSVLVKEDSRPPEV